MRRIMKGGKSMRRKILTTVLVLLTLATLTWAQGRKPKSYHFIYVTNMATLPFYNPDFEGLTLACKEIGELTGDKVTWEVVGPSDNNILQVAQLMEQSIAKRPSGYMVISWDEKVMIPPINKAIDAGIPVVTVDADCPGSKRISYIGMDWYTLGVELANSLLKEINYKGKVALVGIPGAFNMETGFRGFRDVAKNYPNVKIIATEQDNGQVAEAARIAATLIQANPDIAGFAGFDAGAGPGIANALRELGKVGKIKLVGNNVDSAQIQAMKEGAEQLVIGQPRVGYGYYGLMTLWLHLTTSMHYTDNDKVAGALNIPPLMMLGFLRITKENVDLYKKSFDSWDKPRKW